MKAWFKRIALVLLVALIAIQFYQPARNSGNTSLSKTFDKQYSVPHSMATILQQSCYDCHSNKTTYPWYANLQPIRFFMDGHIKEAKQELNFDEWSSYSGRKQASKLNRIVKQVENGDMPL